MPLVLIVTTDGGGDVVTRYGQASLDVQLLESASATSTTFGASSLPLLVSVATSAHVHFLTPDFGDAVAGLIFPAIEGDYARTTAGRWPGAHYGSIVQSAGDEPLDSSSGDIATPRVGSIA